jgi:hypothetical protein
VTAASAVRQTATLIGVGEQFNSAGSLNNRHASFDSLAMASGADAPGVNVAAGAAYEAYAVGGVAAVSGSVYAGAAALLGGGGAGADASLVPGGDHFLVTLRMPSSMTITTVLPG